MTAARTRRIGAHFRCAACEGAGAKACMPRAAIASATRESVQEFGRALYSAARPAEPSTAETILI